MITALRQRRRSRASRLVAVLATAIALVVGVVAPAAAASQATFLGAAAGESGTIHGTAGGHTGNRKAGLFKIEIDGVDSRAYCIDIQTPIQSGAVLDEIDWDASNVDNLAEVEAILRWYHPNGDGPDGQQITGTDAQKAMATQAAIWHYTDGFDLTDSDKNDATVIANYKTILEAVEAGLEGFGEPSVTLSITPPADTQGNAGDLVGPYVINTSATSVTLTASEGVTLHNEDGSPFTDPVVDGTQVWLKSGAEGEGAITASAEAEAGAGRVFYKKKQQRLILASTVEIEASDEAPVSFVTPPPTSAPPTTAPETTTTVPETTTSEVEQTTTTAPDTSDTTAPAPEGGLPVTGAQSLVLVGLAVVLLALGIGFGVVSRRRKLGS
ncbi:MAG TPA: thioester domain-containing protein [Acidimicrobiales bacterium]